MNYTDWLKRIDVDETLLAMRDDNTLSWELRAVAGASVGVDPEKGLAAVIDLNDAITAVVRDEPAGKHRLAAILNAEGNDYSRALWFSLAGRHPLRVATTIGELRRAMKARAQMWLTAGRENQAPTKSPDPYWSEGQEGPAGVFSAEFTLGDHWRGLAAAV